VSKSNKFLVMSRRWGSTPRLTDWLTVNRNVTLTWLDLTSHTATGSARDRQHSQPAARLKEIKTKRPFSGPQFLPKRRNKTALLGATVFAASQPANHCAERNAWYQAGAPSLEQFSPACYEIVRGCRCEYRHPTSPLYSEKTSWVFNAFV
jgi:hypothetical protein